MAATIKPIIHTCGWSACHADGLYVVLDSGDQLWGKRAFCREHAVRLAEWVDREELTADLLDTHLRELLTAGALALPEVVVPWARPTRR